jgi:hypothetical protein
MYQVARNVNQALHGPLSIGVFSFGELGKALFGNSEHGNLMISCITLGAVPSGKPKPDAWQVP